MPRPPPLPPLPGKEQDGLGSPDRSWQRGGRRHPHTSQRILRLLFRPPMHNKPAGDGGAAAVWDSTTEITVDFLITIKYYAGAE